MPRNSRQLKVYFAFDRVVAQGSQRHHLTTTSILGRFKTNGLYNVYRYGRRYNLCAKELELLKREVRLVGRRLGV